MDAAAATDRFAQLFDHHAPELLRYCFRRTADAALAEDLVADARQRDSRSPSKPCSRHANQNCYAT